MVQCSSLLLSTRRHRICLLAGVDDGDPMVKNRNFLMGTPVLHDFSCGNATVLISKLLSHSRTLLRCCWECH